MDQADREPDADAGDRAQDQRQQDEEAAEAAEIADERLVAGPPRAPFGEDEEQAAADGEVGDEDVKDRHRRDEQPRGGDSQMG